MSSPTTRQAYTDIYTLLDRCLSTSNGIRIKVENYDKAVFLRMRIHQARTITREDNARIYAEQPDHPMFGASEYDKYQVRIRCEDGPDNPTWLYIEPRTADILGIETLEPKPELLEWNPEELEPQPRLISPSGSAPSPRRLEYASSVPIEPSSSPDSTTPEPSPTTPDLRRL